MTAAMDKQPACARLSAVAPAGYLPIAPTPLDETRPAAQAIDAFLGETPLPTPDRRTTYITPGSHSLRGPLLHRQKNDSGSLNMLMRPVAIFQDGGQTRAVSGVNDGNNNPCHTKRIT